MFRAACGSSLRSIENADLGGPINGVLTEYKILPSHSLVKILDHWFYVEASTFPVMTVYNTLLGVNLLKAGNTVLVRPWHRRRLHLRPPNRRRQRVNRHRNVLLGQQARGCEEARCVINYKKTPDWEQEVLRIAS
ncbi:hypothetical protein EVJ58_g599 [Rhodofomes roseus]|uniref:Uncharacterized protein n=1 Tax=Rhodofomes roseus TaxID=34475 RepID=A0A4Y9Z5C8_9APHY|nr:hypothetical protein EVJ58_g599 [Rhodofomes roseus]